MCKQIRDHCIDIVSWKLFCNHQIQKQSFVFKLELLFVEEQQKMLEMYFYVKRKVVGIPFEVAARVGSTKK